MLKVQLIHVLLYEIVGVCLYVSRICINYWCKPLVMEDRRYPKRCYYILNTFDTVCRITWTTHVKNFLFLYGFGDDWISHAEGDIYTLVLMFFAKDLLIVSRKTGTDL